MILCSSRAWISLHQIQKSYNVFICQIRIMFYFFCSCFIVFWIILGLWDFKLCYIHLSCHSVAFLQLSSPLESFFWSSLTKKASKFWANTWVFSIQNFDLSVFYCIGNPPCLKNIYFQNMFQPYQLCSHWVVFWRDFHV